ncbi:MAG: hypothetical protein GF310_02715, partial [candidate division Zixibacteria bacterium]|nr:hypothetical protein [candidate division Zixibacteria bacterium]
FTYLKEMMEEYCPTLYEYNDKADIERLFDSLYQEIDDTTFYRFHQVISRFVAGANEAHFDVGSKEDPFMAGIFDGSFRFIPLVLKFLDDNTYVRYSYISDSSIQRGDRILAINSMSMDDLREKIMPHIFSDGDIITYKLERMTAIFELLYYWHIERADSFTVTYIPFGDSTANRITLRAMNRPEMVEVLKERNAEETREDEEENKFYEFEIDDKTAYLKLKTFDWRVVKEYELEADVFYEDIFQQLRNEDVENLIIDLRSNRGGRQEFGNEMIQFILKKDRDGVFRKSISWKGREREYKIPERHELNFKGDIYVLVNGETYSTAANLAQYLKEFGKAVLIGRETGSRHEGFAAGSKESVSLPNSKIHIGIPRYWIQSPSAKDQGVKNRGTLPDYEVRYTITELLDDIDKERELALKLIEK